MRCAERAAADGAADGGQALVGVGDRGDVEAHGVDAHRGEHLRVVLDARELLGVEAALRIGQRAGRDHGAAHDEAVADRVEDVGAAHRERRVRTGREHRRVRGNRQRHERDRDRQRELLLHASHVSHVRGNYRARARDPAYAAAVRVVSLVPSATEIIAALGLADQIVGRSHECNYPPEVQTAPVVSASRDRHDRALERRHRPRRARRARRRPPALRGRRRTARAPGARRDRHAGSVRGVRRLERRGQAGRPTSTSRRSRSIRATCSEIEESIRTLAPAPRRCRARRAARAGDAPPHRHRAPAGARPAAPARVRRRVARPAVRRRALGARDGGPRGRRRGARPCRASVRTQTTWEAVAEAAPQLVVLAPCGFDLERTVERGGQRARRWARASSLSTATPPTRGPARAWPRASRSSHTCCTPTTSRRRRCRARRVEPRTSSFLPCSRK